jgi:hypothetical protein
VEVINMNRKIIIRSEDFDRETVFFLKEVGADMPIKWTSESLDVVRNAVIEAFEKVGVRLQIDGRHQSPLFSQTQHDVRG